MLVAFGDDVEEQVGFVTAKQQIADLIDHQQFRTLNNPTEVLSQAPLMVRGDQLQRQVGSGNEPGGS